MRNLQFLCFAWYNPNISPNASVEISFSLSEFSELIIFRIKVFGLANWFDKSSTWVSSLKIFWDCFTWNGYKLKNILKINGGRQNQAKVKVKGHDIWLKAHMNRGCNQSWDTRSVLKIRSFCFKLSWINPAASNWAEIGTGYLLGDF